MRIKLKTKFLSLSLCFVIVPAIALSAIFIFQFLNFTKETISEVITSDKNANLEAINNGLKLDMKLMDNTIEKLSNDARVLASSPSVLAYLEASENNTEQAQKEAFYKESVTLFMNLYENSYTIRNRAKNYFYPQIRLLNLEEKEIIKVMSGKPDNNFQTRQGIDWIQKAKTAQKGEVCFSRVQIAKNTGEPELRISTPVYHKDKISGIITLNLNWAIINDELKGHVYGKTGYCYVINEDGVLIVHPKYTLKDHIDLKDSKYGALSEIIREETTNWQSGVKEYEFEGVKKMITFMPMKIGEYNYCLAAGVPVEELLETGRRIEKKADKGIHNMEILILISLLLAISVGIPIAMFFANRITSPILKVVELAKAISRGDFTFRINISINDEIGEMASTLNSTCQELSKMISEIQEDAENLARSSEEVSSISTELAGGAEEITSQTTTIAGAAEEMSTNIKTVDDAAGQMSLNSQTVSAAANQIAQNMKTVAAAAEESKSNVSAMAAASEEMTATINEVAENAKRANDTTGEAVETVNQASHQVEELAAAAQEIDKIIAVIVDIAEQTKLLALNATIEAARAGEAGKGFAVVAGEVKELAKQTNTATDDIKKRITAMQNSTSLTVEKIKNVSEVILNVNNIVGTITAAVEEQNSTMQENARNVAHVATGIQEVTRNVIHVNEGLDSITKSITESAERAEDVARNAAEAAKGSDDVSKNVIGISEAVKDTSQGAQQLNSAAGDLANMAAGLQEMMAKFKVDSSQAKKEARRQTGTGASPAKKATSAKAVSPQNTPTAKSQINPTQKPISKEHLPSLDEM